MTISFRFDAERKSNAKADVIIQETLVGIEIWPDVPMIRRTSESLTIIDRLIIESAMALDPVYPNDIEEITGIPQESISAIQSRLVGLGLLQINEGGAVVTEHARTALDKAEAQRLRPTQLTFLYLADTDELIALPQASGRRAPRLDHADSAGYIEIVDRPGLTSRHEFIAERIRERSVLGLSKDIVSPVVTDTVIAGYSKQYRCSGYTITADDGTRRAHLKVEIKPSKTVNVQIPYADRLTARWENLAEHAVRAADSWGPVTVTKIGEIWRYELSYQAATAAAAAGIRLGHPGGLLIQDETDVVYVDVEFTSGDSRAARIFALQHAVAEVAMRPAVEINARTLTSITTASSKRYDLDPALALTPAEVRSVLWANRHYQHIYSLRREEDFPGE